MVSSPVVANPTGTAVAFAATRGNTANRSRGRETVYLLRAGQGQAQRLYSERLQFKGCERAANLAWHGHWLLYSTTEERAAVIDTSLQARPVELSVAVLLDSPGRDLGPIPCSRFRRYALIPGQSRGIRTRLLWGGVRRPLI